MRAGRKNRVGARPGGRPLCIRSGRLVGAMPIMQDVGRVFVLIGLSNYRPLFQELVDGLTWLAKASARVMTCGIVQKAFLNEC